MTFYKGSIDLLYMKNETYILQRVPLTIEEQKKAEGYNVSGVIAVSIGELIKHDREEILDIISNRLIGNEFLTGIFYDIVGYKDNTIHLKITGNAFESILQNKTK